MISGGTRVPRVLSGVSPHSLRETSVACETIPLSLLGGTPSTTRETRVLPGMDACSFFRYTTRMKFLARAIVVLWFVAVSSFAASTPLKAGMDPAKLAEIPKRMQPFMDSNIISGAVTLVARHGEIVELDAVGQSDVTARRKMRTDDLFWIASMTKPMTVVAELMLQDEGKLSVDDPVEKYLPEFKGQWMIGQNPLGGIAAGTVEGFTRQQQMASNTMTLVRPPRAILIRDLLTHTSGLNDLPAPRPNCSLAELVMAYSQQPLKFPPGSKWEYCNSGINALGRIVEVVSGIPYAEFLQKRIFDPLGMSDTTFWPSARQAKRVAKPYYRGQSGALEEGTIYFIKGPLSDRSRTPFPSGGLFSTAGDVSRFYQMMLNGGTWRGKQILSRDAVAQMTRTESGDIKTGFVEGMSWGYGFAVVKEPKGVTRMLSPGTFGHGGAYGTQSWADPKQDLIMVLMIQWSKVPNADASGMRNALQEAAVDAIVKK